MSKFRYTKKQLREFSDYKLLGAVVLDRQSSCINVYAPLYQRLKQLHRKLTNGEELTKNDVNES